MQQNILNNCKNNKNIQRLGDLVDVRNGNTPCRLLPAKCIDANGIDYSGVEEVYATSRIKHMEHNDVLVVNRGHFSVALVGNDLPDGDIALPSFVYTLRPRDKDKVLPEYLYYYLNTKRIQNKLRAIQQGGSIQFISRTDLMNIKMEVPDIKTQQTVASIYKNILKLQQAKQKQIDLLNDYINGLVTEVVKNDRYSLGYSYFL